MATPTIPNGEEYFFPIIYEGNGAGQRVGKFVPFTDNGTIDNSVIYNRADSPKLARTPSSNGNRKTFTISVWYKPTDSGTRRILCAADTSGSDYGLFELNANNKVFFTHSSVGDVISTRTFEDTSKFYHFMLVVDTTQSTASDRVKIYVDGDLITSLDSSTYPSQDFQTNVNSTSYPIAVGSFNSLTTLCTGGYLAEYNFVDGTALTPSTFGVTDTSTMRWIPKTLTGITYGTNGFRLKFQDSSALGDDTSGNGNDLTATNLASTDQTTDSPTQNHCIMDPNDETGSITMSEGNLKITQGGAGDAIRGSLAPTSGKYYFEITATATGADGNSAVGIQQKNVPIDSSTSLASVNAETFIYRDDGYIVNGGQSASGYTNWTQGNVIGIAMDLDNHKLYFSVNGTYINSGNPANGTGSVFNLVQNTRYAPYVVFQGSSGFVFDVNTGQRAFSTAAPTGFSALQQDNLPETDKGITGMVWIKNRDEARSSVIYDSSRGAGQKLQSDKTNADTLNVDGVTKFLKGGVAVGSQNQSNDAGDGNVAWNWVANGGTTASNTDGNTTVTLQTNTTAGFSIGTFKSTSASQTLGHGLGVAPEVIILKCTSTTQNWLVYHKQIDLTDAHYLHLNTTDAEQTGSDFGNTLPTSTVFTANPTGVADRDYCFWAWKSVDGFSKFGKYTGNGVANGPFVYTGFKPAWLIIKRTDSSTGGNWSIIDNRRSTFNPVGKPLLADSTDAESGLSDITMDLLSNGFKIRNTLNSNNNSSGTYVYMAFAEHPFVGDGTNPVTAR